jgi:hypothetical protein
VQERDRTTGPFIPAIENFFPISELNEPLLTEFAKDFWTLAQRRCARA